MVKTLSQDEEARLMSAVTEAIGIANTGVSPSEAVAKVATARDYNVDFTERMVQIFNTSKTLSHLEKTSGADRGGDFDLADPAEVVSIMFEDKPSQKFASEIASNGDFMRIEAIDNEVMEKAASVDVVAEPYKRDGGAIVKKAMAGLSRMKRDREDLKTQAAILDESRQVALNKIAMHFRQGSDKFADVEYRIRGMHGKLGELVCGAAWENLGSLKGLHKRGSTPERIKLYDAKEAPYNYFEQVIDTTDKLCGVRKQANDLSQRIGEYEQKLQQLLHFRTEPITEKAAAGAIGSVIGAAGMRFKDDASSLLFGDDNKGKDEKRVADTLKTLTMISPSTDARIRAVRTESALQDLMASDPVISSYDPEEVITAYNELSSLAPTALQNTVVMRGYLRKLLESSPDPAGRVMDSFEAKQLADIESTISEPTQDTRSDIIKAVTDQKPTKPKE